MRTPGVKTYLIALLCACCALSSFARTADAESATHAYQACLNGIVIQLVGPALAKRFDLLRDAGTLKLTYRVRASGEVESVKVIARVNQFVTDTCVRTIKAAKLPSIPTSVIKEQGHPWVDVDTEITLGH
jgi:hypothetical protein